LAVFSFTNAWLWILVVPPKKGLQCLVLLMYIYFGYISSHKSRFSVGQIAEKAAMQTVGKVFRRSVGQIVGQVKK
jgi:hypothetical protein